MKIESLPLPHFDSRPNGAEINTIVIHSLFDEMGHDKFDTLGCIRRLNECEVSSHYLIGRRGEIYSLVEDEARAWHAGASKMPTDMGGKERVNDFSIGIELVGAPDTEFEDIQYDHLAKLISGLKTTYPIKYIVGHDLIAPGRKTDPGPKFRWDALKQLLKREGSLEGILFPKSIKVKSKR